MEYRIKSANEIKQEHINIEELTSVPVQAQISFIDKQGNTWIRVITKKQGITDNQELVEKNASS